MEAGSIKNKTLAQTTQFIFLTAREKEGGGTCRLKETYKGGKVSLAYTWSGSAGSLYLKHYLTLQDK